MSVDLVSRNMRNMWIFVGVPCIILFPSENMHQNTYVILVQTTEKLYTVVYIKSFEYPKILL